MTSTKSDKAKADRQQVYIKAVESTGVQVIEGAYRKRRITCHSCGTTWDKPIEKRSDVNLAVQLVSDAFLGSYDMALVISGDADVVPALNCVHDHFPEKKICVAFPPRRFLAELQTTADVSKSIDRRLLGGCQLPNTVVCSDGQTIYRPREWK